MLLVVFAAAQVVTGTLNGEPIPDDPVYEVTGCERPDEPDVNRIRTVEAYNESVDAHDAYVDASRDYLECLQAQAQADFDRLSAAITARLETEQNAAQARVDEARERLNERRARFLADADSAE